MKEEYLNIAIQYYVAGRSTIFAGSIPVAGNLFHHAFEMLLKYLLLPSSSARHLKKEFGHSLNKLWRASKKVAKKPALAKFDELVSAVDKVADLRYPAKGYTFSLSPRKAPQTRASGSATKGLEQYNLNLEEIDEFVTALLTGRVTPGWIRGLLGTEARVQYKRDNLHPFI